MDFTPIETQEAFNAAIQDRIDRERKKFSDYDDLKNKVSTFNETETRYKKELEDANGLISKLKQQLGERDSKIKGYESDSVKTRIALENGLPLEMKDRLKGETEEEIKKDAEVLAQFMSRNKSVPPLYDPEGGKESKESAALKGLRDKLLKGD